MASFLKPPHKLGAGSSSSTAYGRSPASTSYSSSGTRRPRDPNLTVAAERERQANRSSRVDLDFEQALASQDTFKLQEGPDISKFGQDSDSPSSNVDSPDPSLNLSRVISPASDTSRPGTATRKLKKPHQTTSPSTSPQAHPMSPAAANAAIHRSPANSTRPSISEYSSAAGSPTPSTRELPDEARAEGGTSRGYRTREEPRPEETKKRSMFRSTATASSPDLGTVARKKKDSREPIPKVPPLPNSGDYDERAYASTDVTPGPLAGWTATLGTRSRTLSKEDSKSAKTLRARTGTFWSRVFSPSGGTVRDKSKPGDRSTPTTPHQPNFNGFNRSQPVPPLPQGYQHGHSPIADLFTTSSPSSSRRPGSSKGTRRSSKPLPPVMRPRTADSTNQDHYEMNVSPVDGSATGSSLSHPDFAYSYNSGISSSAGSNGATRRPADVISRIQGNGGTRRRSMSVGNVEQWNTSFPVASTSQSASSISPASVPERPEAKRSSSYVSKTSDSTATAPVTPLAEKPASASTTTSPAATTGDWEKALSGLGNNVTTLEIKDPSTDPKGRPRSRTQDPISPPPRLQLGHLSNKRLSDTGTLKPGSLMSPTLGFNINVEETDGNADNKSPSIYSTPPTGTTPSSPQFTPTSSTSYNLTRRLSDHMIPRLGPIIVGSTPASIGSTVTTVKIQQPLISTSPSKNTPPGTSPTRSSPLTPQRYSSSSNRSDSPQLTAPASPLVGAAHRVNSLRNSTRPSLAALGPQSSSGSLRPPGRTESLPSGSHPGGGSPKISLSLTSPSQENIGQGHGQALGGRASELRNRYGPKNPACASEPVLIPPGSGNRNADDSINTIRLITSQPKSHGVVTDLTPDASELSLTRISSPSSSMKQTFSNTSVGTSVGRSSISREGSAAEISSTITASTTPEEIEAKAEIIAERLWKEDETFKSREKFSEWMGHTDPLNAATRRYYMNHFDFSNSRIDVAFRRLCSKLFLKGESQVIDRILIEFSRRYWEQNTSSILGSASNVHQVVYSLLLLNTDLHVADLAHHMTRQQFITNTMTTLTTPSRVSSSAPTPARSGSPAPQEVNLSRKPSIDPTASQTASVDKFPPSSLQNTTIRTKRSGSVTSWKGSLSRDPALTGGPSSTQLNSSAYSAAQSSPVVTTSGSGLETSSMNGSTASIHETTGRKHGSGQGSVSSLPIMGGKAWEADIESYLKEIYSAIRMNQILQPTGGATLGRSSSRRGPKHMDMKRGSMRITSLMGSHQNLSGSGGSLDGRLSPSPSFATSINEAALSSTLLAPAPGFATNLSHTIIKETQEDDAHSIKSDGSDSTDVSISDEELALLGAPWAKEGMVSRKIYWESTGKRSKNKAWSNIFVVIQKGQLNMYIFGGNNMQNNRKAGVFGGGNWLSNATNVGEYMLAHSLAHVLPPPGLAGRPHCFVLTLASGMCFFFQAGTEDLCNEWVSTCNYWAARQSKEPLAGGVSNMEYGWSRVELEVGENSIDLDKPGSINSKEYNSETFSIRSGRSKLGRFDGFNTMRSSPLADRIYINDWRPPGHSMIASTHDEETQLEALVRQTTKLKSELKTHNDLREPMIALYSPRSANLAKAMMNWEARSQYLLTELVKYEKYMDSLRNAMKERLRRRGEKALEKALQSSSNVANRSNESDTSTQEVTVEGQETETEQLTPGPNRVQFKQQPVQNLQHRRNGAET